MTSKTILLSHHSISGQRGVDNNTQKKTVSVVPKRNFTWQLVRSLIIKVLNDNHNIQLFILCKHYSSSYLNWEHFCIRILFLKTTQIFFIFQHFILGISYFSCLSSSCHCHFPCALSIILVFFSKEQRKQWRWRERIDKDLLLLDINSFLAGCLLLFFFFFKVVCSTKALEKISLLNTLVKYCYSVLTLMQYFYYFVYANRERYTFFTVTNIWCVRYDLKMIVKLGFLIILEIILFTGYAVNIFNSLNPS